EPCVVHADVHGTEIALDASHDVVHLRRLADVARVAAGSATRRLDLAGGVAGAVTVEVDDRDCAPLRGQRRRVGSAETPRAAGDERDPAADAQVHATSP